MSVLVALHARVPLTDDELSTFNSAAELSVTQSALDSMASSKRSSDAIKVNHEQAMGSPAMQAHDVLDVLMQHIPPATLIRIMNELIVASGGEKSKG